ncbi:MAG: hypothetical protein RLZZ08_1462 [Pseudomonadota bacterium]
MTRKLVLSLLAATALVPSSAMAQDAGNAAVMARIDSMQAEIARLSAEVQTLRAQAAAQPAAPVTVAAVAPVSASAPVSAPAADPNQVKTTFKGAPEFSTASGWSFKPRGRLQLDAGTVSAPDGINDRSTGFGSEVRRAFLGVDGKMPGGFSYRAEVDVAASSVEITDLYLTYQASKELSVTVGQTKPFWGLEELTSDLFTTSTERAPVNTAFGYERRLGLSTTWAKGPWLAQAGVFTDNVADLNNDENNSVSVDGRLVFAPKVGKTQLHFGGSAHFHDLNDSGSSVRYRVRPFLHTPDIRFIDTGNIGATSETGYGLEAAAISGRFHATGEMHWQQVDALAPLANPTFFGGYVEAGLFLTKDTRGYRAGAFDRVRPSSPLGNGGIGAVQVNLRYDYLDLTDAGTTGGSQNGAMASVVWTPTDYTRFMLNYGHMKYSNAALPAAGGDRSYGVDAVGMRAQFDF